MSATRLLRWLTLFALLVAPLAMIGGSPATAHVAAVLGGHCAETEKPVEAPPSAPVDCMIACAGCLPTQAGTLAVRPRLEPAARPGPIDFRLSGLNPEAATPPPRIS
ncbi:MAG TPA: hypothetical protein VGB57_00300 [Allosphingosinicella sp.]|jgi:hypothetical protein